MASYKTPGVYVEEISLLPPSVAEVETAIPAFIGYTKMAKEYANDDLLNVPTKIGSLLEFVQFYGGAPSVNVSDVNLDSSNQVTSVALDDNYYLYESMRMFFSNGGGYCYIVSVGYYGDTIQNGDGITPGFLKGLTALKKVDEPTMLVAPDAQLMGQSDINTLYTSMLDQCADLQDRFAIFDVRNTNNSEDHADVVEDFRSGIGINNLKYGAVYTPWLISNLPRTVKYSDFKAQIKQNGAPVTLADITPTESATLVSRLDNLTSDQATISSGIEAIYSPGGYGSITEMSDVLLSKIKGIVTSGGSPTSAANAKTYLSDVIGLFGSVEAFMLNCLKTPTPTLSDVGDPAYLVDYLRTKLNATLATLKTDIETLAADANAATAGNLGLGMSVTLPAGLTIPGAGTGLYAGADSIATKVKNSYSTLFTIWSSLASALTKLVDTADQFSATIENSAIEAIPLLKSIMRSISANYITLPPSATMAGIYARVDESRGVWKAPANVSLNNVVGVKELIDNKEQEDLNIDVVAGKSVNVIRPFTGKGILVWGARTLAGNDNEWRYIPVRRFYNMVEESVRKATEQFVFEPNDANTWVRIRAMIENFLVQQWKAGALAGAKPDQAFFVRVGLGETMTAQDILEGRMNIEIGMAVVRPAEFIILKFSHKMQE